MYEQVNQENLVVYYEYLIAKKRKEIKQKKEQEMISTPRDDALSSLQMYASLEQK
jgi:hypothetical protein